MRQAIRLLTTAVLMLLCVHAFSQTPVQVMPQLLPPYSLQVSEYFSGATPKIQVLLLNRDINQPTIQVKLRMTVESQNCRLRTKDNAQTPSFTLTSGVPYYLQPHELQAYFAAANLDFTGGYTEQQYVQTGRLPEGLYSFYFEAFELYSGNLVSNKGFSLAWLTLADPPILNTPAKAEAVNPADPQNIIFNWTPRHNTSPTAAYYTDYIFTLVEYNDQSLGPDAAFTSSPPLYTDSVQATTFLYGPDKPQLVPAKRYAWRVQAKAKSGGQQLAMFRNNGFSEVFWFTYQNLCPAPLGVSASVQGQRVAIEWQNNPQHLEWKAEYRQQNLADAQWFSITNTLPRVMLTDLKPGTTYEYRVGGACMAGQFTYGSLLSFTTAGANVSNLVNCGDSTLPAPGGGNTLQTLVAGDTLRAGSFTVHVGHATGSGSFSGTGYVMVPWLANAKVEVRFSNITLSLDRKLLTGVIETTYDPSESGIDDIDEYVDIFTAGYGLGDVVSGLVTADTVVAFTIQMPNGIQVQTPAGYDSATGIGSGPITIILQPQGGGNSSSYTVDKLPTTILDAGGNLYQVDKNGQVVSLGQQGGLGLVATTNTRLIDSDKAVVKFVEYNDQKVQYAFDTWKEIYKKSNTFNKEYEKLNGDYYVSQKAIAPGKTDYLKAVIVINDASIKADSIKFVNSKGTIYKKTKLTDSTYEIAVVGGPEKDAQDIYALYAQGPTKTLNFGKVKVSSYKVQYRKVVLVPVNGANPDVEIIKQKLKESFGKVCVEFEVKVDENFQDNSWDPNNNGLNTESGGLLSTQSDEMKALNRAYKKARTIDPAAIYLFCINHATDPALLGDMPRAKQFGYLFIDGNNKQGKTIAHEVGHGLYRLKHTFDGYGLLKNEVPDNLMDYSDGIHLSKHQWDFIHDPAITFGVFDEDEGSKLYDLEYIKIENFLLNGKQIGNYTNQSGYIAYVAPNGLVFRLHSSAEVSFSSAVYKMVDGNVTSELGSLAKDGIGVVTGFKLNGVSHTARFNNGSFQGYYTANAPYNLTYEANTTSKVIIGEEFDKCQVRFLSGTYKPVVQDNFGNFHEITFENNDQELIGTKFIDEKCIKCNIPLSSKPAKLREVLSLFYNSPADKRIPEMLTGIQEIDFKNFVCAADRFKLIKFLAELEDVPDPLEEVIIRLLRSTPADQAKEIMDLFKKAENLPLLKELYNSISGSIDLPEFFAAFSNVYFNSMTISELRQKQTNLDNIAAQFAQNHSQSCTLIYDLASQNVLYMLAPSSGNSDILYDEFFGAAGVNNDGSVSFGLKYSRCSFNPGYQLKTVMPFDLIKFVYRTNTGDITNAYMPGYCFKWALKNYDDNQIAIGMNKGILVGSLLSMGTTSFTMALFATVDAVIAAGNLYIVEYQEEFNKTPEGQQFIQKWQTFNTYVMVANGAALLYGVGKTIVNYRIALGEMKGAFNQWKSKHYETLKQTNPELAAKLEQFSVRGFKELENLIAKYELTVQRITREFGVSESLAKQLMGNDKFLDLFNNNARIIQGLRAESQTGASSQVFATQRQTLLNKFVENPQLLDRLDQYINEAHDISKKTNLTTADFQNIATKESLFYNEMLTAGIEKDYFGSGLFNSSVFGHEGIASWTRLNNARTMLQASNMSPTRNVMVAEFSTTNAGNKYVIAHSGNQQNTVAGTVNAPASGRLGQFNHIFDRLFDSESKFFEDLWNKIKSGEYQGIREVTIYSERPVCPSCANVINNFRKEFGINIKVFEGKSKPPYL